MSYSRYMRARKQGFFAKHPIRTKVLLWLATAIFGLVIAGFVGVVVMFAIFAKDLPSPDRIVRREGFSTKIYDREGELLYDLFDGQTRRTPVELDVIPLYMRQATIAVEDKNFYRHAGIDLLTPLRIAYNIVINHRVIGGSSLTQQLVKNVLLTQERTITRKLKEFILTLQVESKYSKDEILKMYLNEVPYGGTAWGVETAAEMLYGKPISEVTLAEAVILAGLPQNPPYYSPYFGNNYVGRAYEVARRMREDGYITDEQEKELREQIPEVKFTDQSGTLEAPHFVFYVKQKLIERYGEQIVEGGGLRVTTTLDLKLQEAAQKIVTEEIDKVKFLNITNGAALVLDPKNGQILAMVGSRGWADPDYDGKYNVVLASRQPGSAIKPVTYMAGIREGFTASTMLMDVKTPFPGGDKPEYVPENYDGKFRGPVLVREALGNSLNVPAVKMLAMVGIKNMLQLGYDMGIASLNPTEDFMKRVGLSVTLGGGEVKLIELASAYSAFANGGKKVDPVAILKVTDKDGNVLEEWKDTPSPAVLSPQEAYIMSSILSDNAARRITFGAISQLDIPNRTVAVKTGTTNDKKDNWTVGWSPSVMVGVWVGNNDNSAMKQVASGITGASPIWRRIIMTALANTPVEEFNKPDGLVEMDVDSVSGYPAHDGYPARKEFFIKGTEPTGEDPVHKKVKVCKGEGKLATVTDIGSGNYEEREGLYFTESDPFSSYWNGANKWQEGIDAWLTEQQDPKYHPPTEMCSSSSSMWIVITNPGDKVRIDGAVKIKVAVDDPYKVTKVEFYVDGDLKQTLSNEPWELTVDLDKGRHRVDIKAYDEKGYDGSRFVEFAVGEDW